MTCFVTIVSANYLAYASVLGRSIALHAPQASFVVLVVDRKTDEIARAVSRLQLDVRHVQDLPFADFETLAYKYDILELNTAVKPTFLKSMLREGHDKVVYLDPDIRLYADPAPVLDALDAAAVVVTPHAQRPALDGRRPSDIDFLRNGTFNLGFIGVRAGDDTNAFLDWWEERCLNYGFNDIGFGTFVDQKWIDLAPCYFPFVGLLRHPGCNLAYWNLHAHVLEAGPTGCTVDGQPLVFFHFSGVRYDAPGSLSKHQNRHSVAAGSALATLLADYCAALAAAGHAELLRIPYGFGRLDDGTSISGPMRRAILCGGIDAGRPFERNSPLQQSLRQAGIAPRAAVQATPTPKAYTTHDFDHGDRRIVFVNRVVRLLARLIGTDRVLLLLRYAAFLTRESNYPSVLLDRPFSFEHTATRSAVPSPVVARE